MPRYIVIENTPGYLPDEEEPFTTDDYAEAVAYMNERAAEYENDPDANYRVEYGWASGNNYAAVMVYDESKTHDLGRYIGVELCEEEEGSGITEEGQALGHRYVMGNVNAYCPKCSDEHGVTVLDCDYDLDK